MVRSERLERLWLLGAADQLMTLVGLPLDLEANPDGLGSARSHLDALRASIDRALEAITPS